MSPVQTTTTVAHGMATNAAGLAIHALWQACWSFLGNFGLTPYRLAFLVGGLLVYGLVSKGVRYFRNGPRWAVDDEASP